MTTLFILDILFPLFFLLAQCRQVLKCADNSSHPLSLIIFAIEATRLHIEEAKLMYRQVHFSEMAYVFACAA